ncbi:MAG: hypothetical protein IKZ25_02750 [Clostridia bacterium]|nr:hypothetical protein [Clostridia bacterium]
MKVAFRNTMIIISAIILLAFWGLSAFGAITAISNWDTIVENLAPEVTKEIIIQKEPYEIQTIVTVEIPVDGSELECPYPHYPSDDTPSDEPPAPIEPTLEEGEVNSPFRGQTLYSTIRDSIVTLKTANIESAVNVRDDDIKGSVINYYVPEGGNYPGEYNDIQTVAKKLGVTINVTKVSGGYDYILDVQKAIDDGKAVDLFTVDASQWGPVYKYALPVNEVINFSKLGVIENGFRKNMMDSFSMTLSSGDNKLYYAMAGYAEPYLLVYDKEVASSEGVDPKGYTASYGKMDATVSAIVATTDENDNPVVDSEGICVTKEVSVTGKVIKMTVYDMDDELKPIMGEDGKYVKKEITLNGIIIGNIAGRWNHASFTDVMQKGTNKDNNLYALALPNGDLHRQLIWSIYKIPAFNLGTYKEIRENVVTNSDLNIAFSNFNVYRSLDTSADKIGAALLHYVDANSYQEKLYNFSSSTCKCLGTEKNAIHNPCKATENSYLFWSCMGNDLPEIAKNNDNWEFVSWPNGVNVALGKAPQGINATAAYVEGYCIGKNSNEALAAARVAEELTKLRNEAHQASLKDTLSEEQMEYYIELKDTAYSSDFNAVTNLINSSDAFTQAEKDTDYDECWFSGNLKGNTERFGYFKKKDEFLLTTVKLMRESYGCYAEKYAVLYKIFDVFSDKYAN